MSDLIEETSKRKQGACESFKVLYGSTVITSKQLQAFSEVYGIVTASKIQQEFADRLSVPREDAKSLCHYINYTHITDLSKRSQYFPVIDFMGIGD